MKYGNCKNLYLLLLISIIFTAGLFPIEKFYNYYEKGELYMKRQDWERAIEEFKSAASLEFEDAKRKRTYGTRFIQYFPHREMGISFFHLGEYKQALEQLKLSLAYKRTKRAYAFINKMTDKNSEEIDESRIARRKEMETERLAAIEQQRKENLRKEEEKKKQQEMKKAASSKKKKFETEQMNKEKVPVGALTYDPSMVTQVGSRLSVAVLTFDGKDKAEKFVQSVTEKMITQLVNLRRFRVIERNALEQVMKEQSFGLSGMVDEQTAVEVGKLVGADVIIFGSVVIDTDFGKVSASVINTETSETIIAKESQTENTELKNILKVILHRTF